MRRRTKLIATVTLALIIVSLAVMGIVAYRASQGRIPSSSLIIDDKQLDNEILRAKAGDGSAAARLGRHFLLKARYHDAYYWMDQAKRLGYPNAEEALRGLRGFLSPDETRQIDNSGKE